jgi:hypothetical protein
MTQQAVHTPARWRSPPFPYDYPPNASDAWSISTFYKNNKYTANLFKPSTTSTPPTHSAYDGLRHIWNSTPTFLAKHPNVTQADCFPNIPLDTKGVIYVMYCIAKHHGTPLLYVGQTSKNCLERLHDRFSKSTRTREYTTKLMEPVGNDGECLRRRVYKVGERHDRPTTRTLASFRCAN